MNERPKQRASDWLRCAAIVQAVLAACGALAFLAMAPVALPLTSRILIAIAIALSALVTMLALLTLCQIANMLHELRDIALWFMRDTQRESREPDDPGEDKRHG